MKVDALVFSMLVAGSFSAKVLDPICGHFEPLLGQNGAVNQPLANPGCAILEDSGNTVIAQGKEAANEFLAATNTLQEIAIEASRGSSELFAGNGETVGKLKDEIELS